MVAAHKAVVKKGSRRCKTCGKVHTFSDHWSHRHGTHLGARGEKSHYDRKTRPQGRRKKLVKSKRKARRSTFKRGGTTFGPIRTTRVRQLPRRSAAERRAMGRAAAPKKRRKATRSPAQKAVTARMLAAAAAKRGGGGRKKARKAVRKSGRKKDRSPAQKAATKRMLAGLARKRAGGKRFMKVKRSSGSPRGIPMHLVAGHLAKNPGRKPGSHRVRAHMAAKPGFGTDIRPAHRTRLG